MDTKGYAIPKKQRIFITTWIKNNLDNRENPQGIAGGKSLKGTDCGWRYRVGSYRILCRIEKDVLIVTVVRVGHRQDVYGNLPKV